jgi:hypothetical protein
VVDPTRRLVQHAEEWDGRRRRRQPGAKEGRRDAVQQDRVRAGAGRAEPPVRRPPQKRPLGEGDECNLRIEP